LARWLPNGKIEFIGRIDQQVKIRGHRIEPGEIENRLRLHREIQEALVIDGSDTSGDKYLCAYIVPAGKKPGIQENNKNIDTNQLKKYLSQSLPAYMVPPYFVPLERIPLTPNGKIDKKALPAPGIKPGQDYEAPRNEIEKKLAVIWWEVLGRDAHYKHLPASMIIFSNWAATH
jgi:acyl-coenzyme A synthetase/AMP-(fatty) acid ligase